MDALRIALYRRESFAEELFTPVPHQAPVVREDSRHGDVPTHCAVYLAPSQLGPGVKPDSVQQTAAEDVVDLPGGLALGLDGYLTMRRAMIISLVMSGGEVGSHLVSIGNPGRGVRAEAEDSTMPALFQSAFQEALRLEFYDVLYRRHLGPMRPRRIPLRRDIRRAIRFFRRTAGAATGYTIHCWRGVSRSTAIAIGYLYLIHGDEQLAVDALKQIRPEAAPHPRMVRYFDQVLGSDLSSKNNQLREIRFREMKEWFLNEIGDGDALLEELEPLD